MSPSRRALPTLVAALLGLALVLPGVRVYASLLRHRAAPGAATQLAGYPVPLDARPCDPSLVADVQAALHLPATVLCPTGPVGNAELLHWVLARLPVRQPHDGQPFCDTQVLSNGARLLRWGATVTSGVLVSDPRGRLPYVGVVTGAPPCG